MCIKLSIIQDSFKIDADDLSRIKVWVSNSAHIDPSSRSVFNNGHSVKFLYTISQFSHVKLDTL